ncbi:hypothetical protein QWZ10_13425 [Paracoccus cavernae]|uniref:IS110 family transposase n=1 Tax=Paracoccus cavernae TaxID=1571207 RepID=A0ABT8D7L3_9RHOB|nr:hypothetical protein [Paracoccus cavernae]
MALLLAAVLRHGRNEQKAVYSGKGRTEFRRTVVIAVANLDPLIRVWFGLFRIAGEDGKQSLRIAAQQLGDDLFTKLSG